jgi:hypothetical protein
MPTSIYTSRPKMQTAILRHHYQFNPLFPSDTFPESDSVLIVGEDKDVALVNSHLPEAGQALPHKRSAQSLAAMGLADGQVMDIAAPAIVTAEDSPYEMLAITGHKAKARIASQKARHAFLRVRVT